MASNDLSTAGTPARGEVSTLITGGAGAAAAAFRASKFSLRIFSSAA
eukprot:CAMPEP_0173445098 /NCGR_PEP_ID=MMETSP1357-20121228/33599_2 /TAXON_ID=77926 /ORGANISM="Hemiselmis rufescens, Strain PCC563" /LENGTH=46 /DNA_ID= /DNA_START= /DNA_END= /DNA_ORIENTATION=